YPRRNPVVDNLLRAIVPTAAIVVAILFIVSLFNSLRMAFATNGSSPLSSVLLAVLIVGLAVLIVSVAIVYLKSLSTERQAREALVRDGKVIFVPIERCTVYGFSFRSGHLREPIIRVRFSFVSPRSGRTITRSFTAGRREDGSCLAVGTPIAVL